MTTCVVVNGDWLLTPQRVAIHVPTTTAVLADLHLGYDTARLWGGDALPAFSLEEELEPLGQVLAEHAVRRLIVAGDLVESNRCQALIPGLRAWLCEKGVESAGLVPGNHDRGLVGVPLCPRGLTLGKWTVAHGDGALTGHPVIHGHIHPVFRWAGHVAEPCYLVRPDRIMLPAYSSNAAGLNVLGASRWRRYRCCVIAGKKVFDLGPVGILPRHLAGRPGEQRAARYSPGRRLDGSSGKEYYQ